MIHKGKKGLNQIIYILIIVPIISFGQHPVNGTYCDFDNQCLTFSDSGTFVLDGLSCSGPYHGRGIFHFSKNKLTLEFLDRYNQIKIREEVHASDDSLRIQVITRDQNKDFIPFVTVAFYENSPDEEVPKFLFSTDSTGVLDALIPKSEKVKFIEIWYVKNQPMVERIKIDHDYHIEALIGVNDSDTSFITTGIREYKFKRINTNLIKLGRLDGQNLKMIKMKRIEYR